MDARIDTRIDADSSPPPFLRTPDPAVPPLLEVDAVNLEYRTRQAVLRATHEVSFEIAPADRFVLLGPSGCGKSTLLKAVAGFLSPTSGGIRLDGAEVTGPGPERMVVFQEFDQLLAWKTVRQNVVFPLLAGRRVKRREAEARADHYLAKVGLSVFANSYPHTLSGGMKARVAIARALAMQPRIMLMDEPFAALDALTRRRMQEELLNLWEEVRFTLLFVTHSIEEALILGNRVLLLSPHPGRVRAEIDSAAFGFDSPGSADFQQAVQRLHGLLSDDNPAFEPVLEPPAADETVPQAAARSALAFEADGSRGEGGSWLARTLNSLRAA
ncbi:sulfonate ABC transporter ATP-binding lipoprotein [Betaproteobacteria bacterium]|nr:sulfonate ABC transporter ATP-binding lipoprotein [Betaproteobacteria bacterium]